MNTTLRALTLSLMVAGLAGCMATAPKVDVVEPTQARPVPVTPAVQANGSIFQAAGYRPLYETHRARMVGDVITIRISENVSARQETTSSIEKKGNVSSEVEAIPFINSGNLARLSASGSSNNKFDGRGTTQAVGNFSGSITATVIEVLPNGHLVVSGEKQIGVGRNVDVLRFSGTVDPITIQAGNTVSSNQVANVRVAQTGRGAQQEAQGIGWVARFFLSLAPF
jgi:flagellar L-ring protein FlgH